MRLRVNNHNTESFLRFTHSPYVTHIEQIREHKTV